MIQISRLSMTFAATGLGSSRSSEVGIPSVRCRNLRLAHQTALRSSDTGCCSPWHCQHCQHCSTAALQHCTCPEDLTTLHLLPGKATATPRGDSEFRRHGWNAVMLWACAARNSHLTLRWPETLTCAPESGMNMDRIEAFKHFQTVQRCLMLPTQKAAAKMERESKRWKPSCQGRMLTLHTQDTS
jgi:hypothetical protein